MARTLDWSPVALRPLDPDRDGEALHAIYGDEASCRYLPRGPNASVAETIAMLKQYMGERDDRSWATLDSSGQVTGRVTLYSKQPQLWEAGCMVVPRAQCGGIARRALAQCIDQLFAETDARKVTADIDPDNSGSIRTFEALGFRLEGRLRATWLTHIGVRDSLMFGLLRDDPRAWTSARA